MKKAISINIRDYGSNIEVYATFKNSADESAPGHVYSRSYDTIDRPSDIGTIREIQADSAMKGEYGITLAQARQIKSHLRSYSRSCQQY